MGHERLPLRRLALAGAVAFGLGLGQRAAAPQQLGGVNSVAHGVFAEEAELRQLTLDELVFLGDDYGGGKPEDNCERPQVASTKEGMLTVESTPYSSPSRFATTSDARVVVASPGNLDERALHFLFRQDESMRAWRPFIHHESRHQFIFGSDIAFTPDDTAFFVGTTHTGENMVHVGPQDPLFVTLFRTPHTDHTGDPLEEIASVQIDGVPIKFLPHADGNGVHVVSVAQSSFADEHDRFIQQALVRIQTFEYDSSTNSLEITDSVDVGNVPIDYVESVVWPEFYIHADATEDDLIIVSGGKSNKIVTYDPKQKVQETLELDSEVESVGGISVNREGVYQGLWAIHTGKHLSVYQYNGTSKTLFFVTRIAIPEPPIDSMGGPHYAVSWSGSGNEVIAAISSGTSDYAVYQFDGSTLKLQRELTVCMSTVNLPVGVVTLNGSLPDLPYPSYTPIATQGSEPTPTSRPPTPEPTATSEQSQQTVYLPLALRSK